MKTVSVVVPVFNEEENIVLIYDRLTKVFEKVPYILEMLFIDNCSTDRSRERIEELCSKDKRVKSIFNARNFGFTRSTFYGLLNATGDCAILIFADMQEPPEVIPEFLAAWEDGSKIVIGVKRKSTENPIMYFIRSLYYRFIEKISDIDHIKQFVGFGLYDRSFLEILKELDDPIPYLRGIVAELGYKISRVEYNQNARQKGKTKFNFFKLYDVAMLGITSYSKVLMRLSTIIGFVLAIICMIIAGVTFIIKLFNWEYFSVGVAALTIGVFFLGSIQLFFIGILGEYILNINERVMKRPLVVEEKRINFDK
jgi:glycosyltransferase involved in cell wall biosynthesis